MRIETDDSASTALAKEQLGKLTQLEQQYDVESMLSISLEELKSRVGQAEFSTERELAAEYAKAHSSRVFVERSSESYWELEAAVDLGGAGLQARCVWFAFSNDQKGREAAQQRLSGMLPAKLIFAFALSDVEFESTGHAKGDEDHEISWISRDRLCELTVAKFWDEFSSIFLNSVLARKRKVLQVLEMHGFKSEVLFGELKRLKDK